MTTVAQADALLHRTTANASPFRVAITGHQFGKTLYWVDFVVTFKDEIITLRKAERRADGVATGYSRKADAIRARNRIAREEGIYALDGVWHHVGGSAPYGQLALSNR